MLAVGTYAYSLQHIGGGDLKLLTVAFLWTGPWLAAPFVILLLIFVLIYYLAARLGFAAARPTSAGLRIPLAPSLAGALIGVFAVVEIPWVRTISCFGGCSTVSGARESAKLSGVAKRKSI